MPDFIYPQKDLIYKRLPILFPFVLSCNHPCTYQLDSPTALGIRYNPQGTYIIVHHYIFPIFLGNQTSLFIY